MSDNLNVTPGVGKVVATEELSGVNYQKIKLVGGETGSTSVLGVNPDRSINVSVLGIPRVFIAGGSIAASFTPPANQSVSGAVTAPPGSVMTVNQLAGSVMAVTGSFTPAANQSVSGAVTAPAGSVMTVATLAGSTMAVLATQVTSPWIVAPNNSSLFALSPAGSITSITIPAGSITAVSATAPAGSIMSVTTPAGSTMAVLATQVTSPWIVAPNNSSLYSLQPAGSVLAVSGSFSPAANQSVSGAVTAPAGSVLTIATLAGSIVAVSAVQPAGSLLTAIQLAGSVMAVSGSLTAPPGSVMAITFLAGSIVSITHPAGSVTGVRTDNASVITSAGPDLSSATASILVGVTANTNGSVFTTTGYQQALMQITSGPGASITAALNFEGTLDGTQFVPIQGYNLSTNAISSMATVEGNWAFNTAGLQGMRARVSNWSVGSITARAIANPEDARPFAQVVTGSVATLQGTNPWFTVRPAGSVTAVANLAGSIAAVSATAPAGSVLTIATLAGSVMSVSSTAPAGSVIAVRTDLASVITTQIAGSIMATSGIQFAGSVMAVRMDNVSVLTVQPSGSIMAVGERGTWIVSVAGGYPAGTASVVSGVGILNMGVRNDTMSSTLSVNDASYQPIAVGPVGEIITANAPISKWISGQTSVMYGTSVQAIAAAGAGIFNYIKTMQVLNDSGTYSRVKVTSGLGSVMAWTAAPSNGGSNIIWDPPLKSGANAGISVSISGVSSVYVTLSGFISNT